MYLALGNSNPSVPLPIELLSFNARWNAGVVDLTWSTASETNNDFFVIERASEQLDWRPIETITGAGNSTTRINYATVDPQPLPGLSYYRLKQVDFDGTYSYSEVRAIRNMQEADEDHAFLFPNPAYNGRTFVRIPASFAEFPVQLRLFDMQGKLVWSKQSTRNEALIEVNYGALPSGMYLLQLQSELFSETKKLVVE